MEGIEGNNSSEFTVRENEAPESYGVEARVAKPLLSGGSTMANGVAEAAATPVISAGPTGTRVKKKRGRPRNYRPDGSVVALSPTPISASIPLTGEFSIWKQSRGRPVDSSKKKQKLKFESLGERVAYPFGANFTPHVIIVNAGEDVSMKIISFSQQGSRAICILAANGTISNVTLRQPSSSGGTLTYEGYFEILSLTGSFMLTDDGVTKSRSGGMSVSLAGPDGRVLGGGLAGLLVAAGPVQVVIGSFLPGHQLEQNPKKPRLEQAPNNSPVPSNHNSGEEVGTFGGLKPNLLTPSSSSFYGNNAFTLNNIPFSSSATRHEISFHVPESNDPSLQKCEISC